VVIVQSARNVYASANRPKEEALGFFIVGREFLTPDRNSSETRSTQCRSSLGIQSCFQALYIVSTININNIMNGLSSGIFIFIETIA
jgi:hypothetical protein